MLSDRCYGTWETVQKNWCNTRKIGKNGIKKVKLNGLIHLKIVLVKDHVEYEKKTRKSNHSNLIRQSVSDIWYGTWETVRKYAPTDIFFKKRN